MNIRAVLLISGELFPLDAYLLLLLFCSVQSQDRVDIFYSVSSACSYVLFVSLIWKKNAFLKAGINALGRWVLLISYGVSYDELFG